LATNGIHQALVASPQLQILELRKREIQHVVCPAGLKLLRQAPRVDVQIILINFGDPERMKSSKRRFAFISG
jgi:hypothetical protein